MKSIELTFCTFCLVASTGCGLPRGPEATAKEYLEMGSDEGADVAAIVEDGCKDEDILGVTAVKFLGVPIDIQKLDVKLEKQDRSRATVSYTAQGPVKKAEGTTTTVGPIAISGSLEVGEMTKSGTLELIKDKMSWKVACP